MQLASTVHGPATSRPPLLIAHGLFGSARNWGVISKRLAQDRQVIAVDMRNHGDSPRSPVHDYPSMAADLAETIAAHGGRADVLGHSMGGKAAMALALSDPALVNRLIVADVAPVAYRHSQLEYVRAMQAVDLAARRPPLRRRRRARPLGAGAELARLLPAEPRRPPGGRLLEAEPRGARAPDAGDHGLPRPRRQLRRPDAVPDRRHLRPTSAPSTGRASAPSSRPPSTGRSPAPATGCTPTRPARSSRRSPASSTPEGLDARPRRC